jgi:glycosyltransferase involved in cell wall biosynthesis/GT2 family glycosyltransferase
MNPRVTLGVATYERDTYLEEAVASCLHQTYSDLEVLVVLDGGRNPVVDEVLARFDDPRLRIVRHDANRGIAEAYNTIVREARGELIAMLGDDDRCEPDRIARQVAVFDRHPDTGVVHGAATIIDGAGVARGAWPSRDRSPHELLRHLVREHNTLVDPSRMVHRRVYEAVGGYDPSFRLAQDFDFWLRAVRRFRFRDVPGAALIGFRRHGENTSDESARELEVQEVQRALRTLIDAAPLRELVPELDWGVMHPQAAERRALEVLAGAFDRRAVALPGLARELRARAARVPASPRPAPNGRKIVLTSFGFNDSGGGTTVPRVAAKELARRGWDVTVFHAATRADPSGQPYVVREWMEDGVRLVGVHNRGHGLWDLGNPLREIDDPPITQAFAALLDRVEPDVVHFHNLHNLGAALIDEVAARGVPSYFSTHNYWLICPRAYLLTGEGAICGGPGDRGADCASCVGSPHDRPGHQERLAGIRDRFTRGVSVCLAVSDAMRATLAAQDYPREMIDVVRQAVPAADETWERLGRDRRPGRTGERLTVAFFGSALPHKGPQLLVEAAQRSEQDLRVLVHGEVDERFAARLRAADARGVVELCGAFSPAALPELLAGVDVAVMPSMWWDCAPLMAAECLAGRVPLVVPRLGGLGEAIRDGVDGLFFDALDAGDLARQLDRLVAEPGLLERMQAGIEAPRPFAAYVDELEAYYAGERPSRGAVATAAPAVTWQGDHGLHTSLSHVNNEVTARLDGVGRLDRTGAPIDGPLPHAADVEVRHQWPPDLRPPRSGRLAVIQPWEFGAIPADWLPALQRDVDELWVPSEYVGRMYLDAGLDEDRVHVVPNGVDLERFAPEGETYPLAGTPAVRFLFVGGAIARKGVDVLLAAWPAAFAGRDDVQLVIKDFGSDGVYRGADRSAVHAAAETGSVVHLDADLADEEMAALYRACDVLVHPYRGEGFAMPVLEAMASGVPVIHTGGGPTDEFCPPRAGWRVRAHRLAMPGGRVDHLETIGEPWMLEPDPAHLAQLLRAAADAGPDARTARGAVGRAAALHFGWERIAALYGERARALAARAPRVAASDRVLDGAPSVLATPAWRAADDLPALLRAWEQAPAGACLYLLADPATDGTPAELEARVMSAAAGIDLDACADITILREHAVPGRDAALHAAADLYVPLHAACAGHVRMAGDGVVAPAGLGSRLAARSAPRAA